MSQRMTRDDFDFWISDMNVALESFFNELPANVRAALDESPESLDALEAWILERYPDSAHMIAADQASNVDGASRYIGEVFRKAHGGHWDIDLDHQESLFFSLPFLTGGSTPIAPHSLATATADRRTGTFLRTVLEATRP